MMSSRTKGSVVLASGYLALTVVLALLLFRGITWEITTAKRVGLAAGCVAYVLFCCQFLLSARLRWLDRLVSLDRLYSLHGVLAVVAVAVAAAHGQLVTWGSEHHGGALAEAGELAALCALLTTLGGIVLLGTVALERMPGYVSLRRWTRRVLRLRYHWCVWLHNFAVVAATVMLVHVMLLSKPSLMPFKIACATLYAVCLGTHLYHRLFRPLALPVWRCTAAVESAPSVRTLRFAGEKDQSLPFAPGQFAFLSLSTPGLREPHPFTIAGGQDGELEFSIKAVGDWSERLATVEPGHEAKVHGPFGAFTACELASDRPLVLLAGGIGITPFLAMARDLGTSESGRPIVLVWSVSDEQDAFARDELAELENRLPGLRVTIWVTGGEQGRGRLGQEALAELLADELAESDVFLCGPQTFMVGVAKAVCDLGVPRGRLHQERFGY